MSESRKPLAEVISWSLSQLSDSVIVTDLDDRITFVNKAFERNYGYREQDILGQSIGILLGISQPGIHGTLPRNIQGLWIYNEHSDGRKIPVYLSRTEVKNDKGEIVATVCVTREVSELTRARQELREAEEQKRKLEEQLRQSQKLEAIGRLAGGIAHDFNNILGSIIGYSELIQEDLKTDTLTYENLLEVLLAAQRAKNLVGQILGFSRRNLSALSAVDLKSLCDEAILLIRPTTPSSVKIVSELELTHSVVIGDSDQLLRVMVNLLVNAVQAILPNTGVINLSLKNVIDKVEQKELQLPEEEFGYVLLEVSDNGRGINSQDLPNIFDPFFTTRNPDQGSGMGLAVVHGVVSRHKGFIRVESEVGKGTKFSVFFVCSETGLVNKETEKELGEKGEIRGRVLFIDDEEQLVGASTQALSRLGLEVVGVTKSSEALERFRSTPRAFDLVITDQTMPELTGIVLAQELWKIRRDIPIIICSGYNEVLSAEEAQKLGFSEYLKKPVARKTWETVVAKALKK